MDESGRMLEWASRGMLLVLVLVSGVACSDQAPTLREDAAPDLVADTSFADGKDLAVALDVLGVDHLYDTMENDGACFTDCGADVVDTVDLQETAEVDVACVPDCEGLECGDDGCGGSCGDCDNADECDGIETCEEGLCVEGSPIDCDDGNPCTVDECKEGECANELMDLDDLLVAECLCETDDDCAPLDDGNLCNGTLVCDEDANGSSTCVVAPETVVECLLPEGLSPDCNAATCDPQTGECQYDATNEADECDDEDACTQEDTCVEGECVGATVACDDSNLCTDDSCDPDSGCVFENNDTNECSNGTVCDGIETCVAGECVAGTALECNDDNPCTDDSCDAESGCVFENDDSNDCNNGSACDGLESCVAGACVAGTPLDCGDDNPCTDDSCDAEVGCVFENDDTNGCSNDTVCDGLESCVAGECVAGTPPDCDDSNVCTTDWCDPVKGCLHGKALVPCDDGDLCTIGDICLGGVCQPGPPKDCDDNNPCTDDSCDAESGCVFANDDTNDCNNATVCDGLESCVAGECVAGSAPDCNDANVCTDDSCAPATGCVHANNTASCLASVCTVGDHCDGGACVAGPQKDCDDGNDCTDDSCMVFSGGKCFHTKVADGAPCDDGAGVCLEGVCTCAPSCDDKECGADGCGGSCGTCESEFKACTETVSGGALCASKMADIPGGTFWMGCNEVVDDDCGPDEYPYHEVHLDMYQMDVTEVTAGDYAACVAAGTCGVPGSGSNATYKVAGMESHPINYVNKAQAKAYCAWVGKRLPTEAEWEKAARGADGRKFPWGNIEPTCSYVVMDENGDGCGTDKSWPVCSKSPTGDSPYGLCDSLGNAMEWVKDPYAANYYAVSPGENPPGPGSGSSSVMRGGSYVASSNLRVSDRASGNPTLKLEYIGFRCARSDCGDGVCDADGGENCSTCIQDCSCGQGMACDSGTCVCAPDCTDKPCGDDGCGGSCGTCEANLEQCTETATGGTVCASKMVPVAAGKFWMGCNEAVDDECQQHEYPYHEVYLDAYDVDRTEVTAEDYASCVGAGGCTVPAAGDKATYGVAGKETHPVNDVNRGQAVAFCNWVGKRLPTEAEWEKAARGTEGATYSWGNEALSCDLGVIAGCGASEPKPVCSKSPAGDSPYGACDMTGNLFEWVSDYYGYSYYAVSPLENPQGPDSGTKRIQRGGSYVNYGFGYLRAAFRHAESGSYAGDVQGFRCVKSQ